MSALDNVKRAGAKFVKFILGVGDRAIKILEQKTKKIIDPTRTPQKKFEQEMQDLQALRDVGAIDPETLAQASAKVQADLTKATTEKLKKGAKEHHGDREAASSRVAIPDAGAARR